MVQPPPAHPLESVTPDHDLLDGRALLRITRRDGEPEARVEHEPRAL